MTAREYMAYSRQRSDNIKAIIAEHKQRKGMTDGSQGGRHQSGDIRPAKTESRNVPAE